MVINLFELKNDCAPSPIDEEDIFGKEEIELIIINNNEDYLFKNLIRSICVCFIDFIWFESISEIH